MDRIYWAIGLLTLGVPVALMLVAMAIDVTRYSRHDDIGDVLAAVAFWIIAASASTAVVFGFICATTGWLFP